MTMQLLSLVSIYILTNLVQIGNSQSTFSTSINDVTYVDLRLADNIPRHHTIKYRQIERPYTVGPSMVLRRGEPLDVIIHLRKRYNMTLDRLRLEFSFGLQPQLDKGTLVYLPIESAKNGTYTPEERLNLKAKVLRILNENQLYVQINLPPNMAIGIWRFKISTKTVGANTLYSYTVREALYVIFNAWSEDDAVYMQGEEARQEYVLNEVGKIYSGSYTRPTSNRWIYGQFNEAVLPAVMMLLDKTRLDVKGRADVVKVSRAVSAMVNSHDENGLLVGNWSGNYGDGLAPWQWSGSAVIFEKYLRSGGRPVKFAQCWVFGAVTTTTLRTLGIPARTISNFVSAHDTDFSLTVDKFYSSYGGQLTGINGDSIWNFHVWSDAWMKRHDLPPGFGGWQAIDATPQEMSMGMYQLGPASLEAIKRGKVGFAYDVGFVYSEVNADLVHWSLDDRSRLNWRKTQIQTDHVGRKILTKRIGYLDDWTRFGVNDAEDIVNQYKFVEGSREERMSYYEASRSAGLNPLIGN